MMKHLSSSLLIIVVTASIVSAQTFSSVIQRLQQLPVEQRRPLIERFLNEKRTSPIIEQDSLLHFVLYGAADTVLVNGNLQRWTTPDTLSRIECGIYDLFYRSYIVPPDARLDYQLIVNGKYITDPQNPNITPSGYGPHSEVRMPKFVPSPYLALRPEVPRGEIDSLAPSVTMLPPLSRYRVRTRPLKVYRPFGYASLSSLPVLYVHDGFEALDHMHLPRVLDNLIAEGRIPPVLAVFVPPVDREGEYFGASLDRYVKYLTDDIVPLIDMVYRTDPRPERRAMTGISAGGHLALYTVMKRPDIFGAVGAQSFPFTPQLRRITEQQSAGGHLSASMKIYMDCGRFDILEHSPLYGDLDFLEMQREYSRLLSSLRLPHYYREVNDGHEWAGWRERIPEMLIYFFGGMR